MEDLDPAADPDVEEDQDRDGCQARRRQWVDLGGKRTKKLDY